MEKDISRSSGLSPSESSVHINQPSSNTLGSQPLDIVIYPPATVNRSGVQMFSKKGRSNQEPGDCIALQWMPTGGSVTV